MRDSVSARDVLQETKPRDKAAAAHALKQALANGVRFETDQVAGRPGRPEQPVLVPPRQLAKRKLGTVEGRAALLHAIAHIELNAIDLAADMLARFSDAPEVADCRGRFVDEWSNVCDEEARHFILVSDRLDALGFPYGHFPAHDGLWTAAQATAHDLAARLAVAPLILEARGLDVTPAMICKLDQAGDTESANILRVIYEDEIGHVATGMRWFTHVSTYRGENPESLFLSIVNQQAYGLVKPPFNRDAREKAGLPHGFYNPFNG